jgi:hypothetical protein
VLFRSEPSELVVALCENRSLVFLQALSSCLDSVAAVSSCSGLEVAVALVVAVFAKSVRGLTGFLFVDD